MKQPWKQRLKSAREEKGLSKSEFAIAVGVSAPTATDWEKSVQDGGIAEMKGNNLTKVCEVLGISAEWLLDGGDKGKPKSAHVVQQVPAPYAVDDRPTAAEVVEMADAFSRIASPKVRAMLLKSAKAAAESKNVSQNTAVRRDN